MNRVIWCLGFASEKTLYVYTCVFLCMEGGWYVKGVGQGLRDGLGGGGVDQAGLNSNIIVEVGWWGCCGEEGVVLFSLVYVFEVLGHSLYFLFF